MQNPIIKRFQTVMWIGFIAVGAFVYFLGERVSMPVQRVVSAVMAILSITLAVVTLIYGDDDEEGVLSGSDWRTSLTSASAWKHRLSTIGLLLMGLAILLYAISVGGDIIDQSSPLFFIPFLVLLFGGLALMKFGGGRSQTHY